MRANKSDIVAHVFNAHDDITADQAREIVDTVLDGIASLTRSHDMLVIRNFGTFAMRHRRATSTRNPRTGDPMTIPARTFITFRESKTNGLR